MPGGRDAWDQPFTVQRVNWNQSYYNISTPGPRDGFDRFSMMAYLELRTGKQVDASATHPNAIELTIEPDRGAFNGLASITGSVADQAGVMVSGAGIAVREAL